MAIVKTKKNILGSIEEALGRVLRSASTVRGGGSEHLILEFSGKNILILEVEDRELNVNPGQPSYYNRHFMRRLGVIDEAGVGELERQHEEAEKRRWEEVLVKHAGSRRALYEQLKQEFEK